MKNTVYVGIRDKMLVVNNDPIRVDDLSIEPIKNVLPENIEADKVTAISWTLEVTGQTFFSLDGDTRLFENTEENYNKYVKPYVDMWQAKKDEQQQGQEEIEAERNKFENRQARALVQLNYDFETVKERSHIKSSLGFTADANQTANENVTGLLVTIGDGTAQFCDYYNQFHEVNKADLETLQNEIIQNAQNLYQQKWVYRTQIENCTNNEGLDAVTEAINFTYMDFTTPAETDQSAEQTE